MFGEGGMDVWGGRDGCLGRERWKDRGRREVIDPVSISSSDQVVFLFLKHFNTPQQNRSI